MTLWEIKQKIISLIDENREELIFLSKQIEKNPELGFCEEKTSMLIREKFSELGINYKYPLAVTGTIGEISGRNTDFNVCIIGEMDALKCSGSVIEGPMGRAHACGHHAQVAAMLGAAIGLAKSGVMQELDGKVSFLAAPAEEFIDLDYRKTLKNNGIIQYFGGKQQLIAEGVFDDIDMALMIHAQPKEENRKFYVRGNNLGFLAKTITFQGKAVHGSIPFDGVNALNAAALAILGMHANRETFREEEKIRIHPIITKGGDVVNSVPDEVVIETYIRGAAFEDIKKGNRAVERACVGAAKMVGAEVTFENMAGYLPLKECYELSEIMESNAAHLMGTKNLIFGEEITGSSDIGDLSSILPVVQPSIGGFSGELHSQEFCLSDYETAILLPAKIMALTAVELLYDGAKKAKNVKEKFIPKMTKKEYISYLEENQGGKQSE